MTQHLDSLTDADIRFLDQEGTAGPHHALADGASGLAITSVLFDTTPEAARMPPPDRGVCTGRWRS